MPRNFPQCALCEDGIAVLTCSGCGEALCSDCQVNKNIPLGMHEPDDHLDANDVEEEDD